MIYYQSENLSGTYDFRCKLHADWYMEPHMHEYSELIYCKSGSGTINVNGRHLQLLPGRLIWIPPNYIHEYTFQDGESVCAVFSNDFVPLYRQITGKRTLLAHPIDMAELCPVLNEFHLVDAGNHLKVCGLLNLICARVIEHSDFAPENAVESILYQKVISYISTHYIENITLESVANKFGYNPKYLSHALHTLTTVNFRDLLAMYRINRAKELLIAHREKSISEIAYDCGFTAQNTFNRTFKKMTSMTPFAYRNASHQK